MSYSDEHISNLLKKTLDVHGFGFHYAVMKRANELREESLTNWHLKGTEFPVSNKNESTHIDFVLMNERLDTFLIAECKRADPAKANWCFVKAPYTWSDEAHSQYIQFDKLTLPANSRDKKYFIFRSAMARTTDKIANLGFEISTGEKGDGLSALNKSSINAAVTQVTRSASGFFNYFVKSYEHEINNSEIHYRFIPVIFTTAQLWLTDTDISMADISTGNLPADSIKAQKVDWLWFNYHRSENLSPDHILGSLNKYISKEYYEFSRTTAIVSSNGIDNFLKSNLANWLLHSDY